MTPFQFGCHVQQLMKKQALMGIGGLAGMATAPEGEEDLSVGRGALRGAGTMTGAGAGGFLGAGAGGALGTLAGGLAGHPVHGARALAPA